MGEDVLLWREIRTDVLRRLEQRFPELPFDTRVPIAEYAAREVDELVRLLRTPVTKED